MTTRRKEIDDLGELARQWRRFGADWDDISQQALQAAFTTSGVLEDIWNRTPKSLRERYAAMHKGIDIKGVTRSGHVKLTKGWSEMLTDKQLRRVQEYGQERLANSLLPGGPDWKSLDVRRKHSGEVSIRIASSLEYAMRMHEAKKPKEGQYWEPGLKRGWSAKMSGNNFLMGPVEKDADEILAEYVYQLDRQMRNRGLI